MKSGLLLTPRTSGVVSRVANRLAEGEEITPRTSEVVKAAWQTAWLKVKKIAPNIWGGKPRGNRLAEGRETTP